MWATRPHLGSIFEKLLHRKTFGLPAARSSQHTSTNKKAPPKRCFFSFYAVNLQRFFH